MASGLGAINWQAPWLAPLRAQGQTLVADILAEERRDGPEATGQVARALDRAARRAAAQGGCALPAFVPQLALTPGLAYEWHIHLHRSVPTRDGLHDFFNGLIWLHWPHTKLQLQRVQARALAHTGGRAPAQRGPLRDALTVFDENGALLQAPEPLWQALRARDWPRLFGPLRALWAQAQLYLVGHALLEKLVRPRAPMVAHVLRLEGPAGAGRSELDRLLAQQLDGPAWAAKPFVPLPVLGVPGWWAPNQDPAFYADTRVFRPPPLQAPAASATASACATLMPSTAADRMPPA